MRHCALTCCIIPWSIIKVFQIVTEIIARNEVKIWISGNNLKNEDKQSYYSFIKYSGLTYCIILQSINKIFQMINEILARNEGKVWITGHNQ